MVATKDEAVRQVIRELLRMRETMPLKDLPKLLESYGHIAKDDAQVGRTLAEMMRQILKDPMLIELIRLVRQLRFLRPLNEAFNKSNQSAGIAQTLGEEFWNQYLREIPKMEKRVDELLTATKQKRELLEFLAENLGESEEFELPEVEASFPPSPVLSNPSRRITGV